MEKKKGSLKKLQARLEVTRKHIDEAERDGADLKLAIALLNEVEPCLKKDDEAEATKILDNIDLMIKQARAKKKYEMMIFNSLPIVEKAKRAGADVSSSETLLAKARELLDAGEFGDAHEHIKMARREAENAKRFMMAKVHIQRVAPLVEAAKRKGVKVQETTKIILEAWKALNEGNYDVVTSLMKNATTLLDIAEEQKSYGISIKDMEARIAAVAEAGVDTKEMAALLKKAKQALEKENYGDVRTNVNLIRREIEKIILQREAGLTVRTIQQFIKEAKRAGIKSNDLEDMLEKASVAIKEGDFSHVRAIELSAKQAVKNLKLFDTLSAGDIGVIDKEREEGFIALIREELEDSKELAGRARNGGIDVSEIDELIKNTEGALSDGQFDKAFDSVRRLNNIIHDEKGGFQAVGVKKRLDEINSKLEEAKVVGLDVAEVEGLIIQAKSAADEGHGEGVANILKKATLALDGVIQKGIEGKHPRLKLSVHSDGIEAQKWGRARIELSNTGNTIAKNIDVNFFGEVEVKDWKTIPSLLPGQNESREISLKSFKPGKLPLDMTVSFQKSFDDTKFQLNDLKDVDVTESGTFIVEDAFLIYNNGLLISKQTRRLREEVDGDLFSAMLTAISQFAKESFNLTEKVALSRLDFGNNQVLIERGGTFFVAVTTLGEDSVYMSFYISEIVREIEEKYGEVLKTWEGDLQQLTGIDDIVRKLLLIKNTASGIPENRTSILTPALDAMQSGGSVPDFKEKITELLMSFEEELISGEMGETEELLKNIKETVKLGPQGAAKRDASGKRIDPEILKRRMYDVILSSGRVEKDGALLDARLENYMKVVGKILDAVSTLKEDNGIPTGNMLAAIAVKHPDYERWSEVMNNMRILILEQLNARELKMLKPDDVWSGLKPTVKINEGMIRKSYKHIATKIINVLQYMPPEKLLANIKKGTFTIGVEGQQTYITAEMISISFSLPPGAFEGPLDSGVVYIDSTLTEEMKSEISANKIIERIMTMRQELEIEAGAKIEVQILASDALADKLEKVKDSIKNKCNAYDVLLPLDDPFGSGEHYVTELDLDEEKCKIGIVQVELDG